MSQIGLIRLLISQFHAIDVSNLDVKNIICDMRECLHLLEFNIIIIVFFFFSFLGNNMFKVGKLFFTSNERDMNCLYHYILPFPWCYVIERDVYNPIKMHQLRHLEMFLEIIIKK